MYKLDIEKCKVNCESYTIIEKNDNLSIKNDKKEIQMISKLHGYDDMV